MQTKVTLDENELKSLLQSPRPRPEKRGWRCPDETALAAYVDGGVASSERRRIEGHLAGCAFCLGQVTFLSGLQETQPEKVPAQLLSQAEGLVKTRPRRFFPGLHWGLAPAAAALVALISLGGYELYRSSSPPPPPPPAVRSAPLATDLPAILFPEEGQVVVGPELEIRWQEVPRSLFYDVRVLSAAGDRVWEARVESTRAQLPVEIRLATGEGYFVSVRAHLAEGRTRRSPVVGFEVRASL